MSPSVISLATRCGDVTSTAKLPSCTLCALRHACRSQHLASEATWQLEFSKRKVKRGATLFRTGERLDNLYAVRSGAFKSNLLLEDGREQVTGFKMAGDVLGLDAIGADEYMSDVVALEDSEVCVIPYGRVLSLLREVPEFAAEMTRMLSREIGHDQSVMAVLGTMQAEERVIVFLLDLAQRYQARGYAANEFILRMTREEIGSYLGLKLETVSRVLSRLQARGLITLHQNRTVRLSEPDELRAHAAFSGMTQARKRPGLRSAQVANMGLRAA